LEQLLNDGKWNIIALSRKPDGAKAKAIRDRGVQLILADLEDKASLVRAFAGAYGVYGVTTPENAKGKLDTDMERRQGYNIVDACVENNIKHLVLSTVLLISEEQTSIPYVGSKMAIEQYAREKNIPCTFLRPASFMDEIGGPYLPLKKQTVTAQADSDAKVPYIACRDIGKYARMAFNDPDTYLEKALNLVGDFISGDELAQILTALDQNGKIYRHKPPSRWLMWIFAREWLPLRAMFEEWGRAPHPQSMLAAISNTRELYPDVTSFEDFLKLNR
ncbi:MAG: NmrA/HSCARG family protein, partial [Lewinella sp.]|nr:NmrA/HSCARG family protein [Lewinella sp.]